MPKFDLNDMDTVIDIMNKVNDIHFNHLDSSKKPILPHHRDNFKTFNKLTDLIEKQVKELNNTINVDELKDYKAFHEAAVIKKDMKNLFILEIEGELEKFRDLKSVLIKEYDKSYKLLEDTKRKLSNYRIKNRKEISQINQLEREMKKAKNMLVQHKDVNSLIKKEARKDAGIIKHSSLLHSILNYGYIDDYKTYTGAAGILLNVSEVMRDLLKDDEWKHFRSRKIMRQCQKMLTTEFSKCIDKYNEGMRTFRDMKKREESYAGILSDNSDSVNVKAQCQAFRNRAHRMIDSWLKNFGGGDKALAWANIMQADIKKMKEKFVSNYKGDLEKLASLFADTCFSSLAGMDYNKIIRRGFAWVTASACSVELTVVPLIVLFAFSVGLSELPILFFLTTVVCLIAFGVFLALYGGVGIGLELNDLKEHKSIQTAVNMNNIRNQQISADSE